MYLIRWFCGCDFRLWVGYLYLSFDFSCLLKLLGGFRVVASLLISICLLDELLFWICAIWVLVVAYIGYL